MLHGSIFTQQYKHNLTQVCYKYLEECSHFWEENVNKQSETHTRDEKAKSAHQSKRENPKERPISVLTFAITQATLNTMYIMC